MGTLPTLTVLLDDGSGTFPYDITSKVLAEPGYKFDRGRQDWQGGVTAGSMTLTLNNADGRFTPGSTIIANPSPIKVDQRIRLKETINGVTYTRFTGYVKSWPVSWPAVVPTWSTVQITATDAQARAERQVLRSAMEQEIFPDAPTAYYALSEPTGATVAADSSGNQSPLLTLAGSGTNASFGVATGPNGSGLTAAQFSNPGKYLRSSGSLNIAAGAVELWFTAVNVAALRPMLGIKDDALDTSQMTFFEVTNATVGIFYPGVGVVNFTTVADGLWHHLVLTTDAGTTKVYLDGTLVLTDAALPSAISYLTVGGITGNPTTYDGAVASVAVYSAGLSAARVASHYAVGMAALESGTARITRLAGYANLPIGTLDTSLTSVPFTDLAGRSAWDALQQVTDAEAGVSFVDGSGNLTFHNRNRSPAKTTPDLTLAATYVTPDVQPVDDDQQLINYFEVTAEGTSNGAQIARNVTAETTHGRYSASASYLVTTDQEALDRANWIVGNFAEPTTRYGTLTINLYGMTAAQAATVLTAIEINCWLRITGAPSQNTGGTQVDLVVEGYTESQSADEWKLTCNVVSRSLFRAWVLDSTTLSVLDSTTRLYV